MGLQPLKNLLSNKFKFYFCKAALGQLFLFYTTTVFQQIRKLK
jgi:hypothetical protein